MKSMKRMLAMLLCVVMVAGLIPASIMNVFAVSDTIYVLAGGDYQEGNSDGTTLHVNSSENVRNILTQIYGAGYTTMDAWRTVLGEPDATVVTDAASADSWRIVPGTSDYYLLDGFRLRLHADEDGILRSVFLMK